MYKCNLIHNANILQEIDNEAKSFIKIIKLILYITNNRGKYKLST